MKKIKVLIFGCNGYGKKVKYLLDDEKYEVIGFIDNFEDIQSTGVYLGGTSKEKVFAPSEIKQVSFDYIVIAINRYDNSMKMQLVQLYGKEILSKIVTFEPYEKDIFWLEERHAMLRNCADEIYSNSVQGNVAELGVYKGNFAKYINRYFKDRKLYLFDTFQGFDKKDKETVIELGIEKQKFTFDDTSINLVLDKMTYKENIIVKKGYFPDTATNLEDRFCFVSIDADLYNPILKGLEYFYPRLEQGGYIFVHDFGGYSFTGCKKAVLEYCNKKKISYVPLMDNCLSVVITK